MARPVRSDYDNPGQFAQALREYEAANASVVTPEQTVQIETAAQTAGGFFTGSQQDYIDDLVANRSRPGVQPGAGTFEQRMAALNTLVAEGQAKPVTPVTVPDGDDGEDGDDGALADAPGAKAILRDILATYGLQNLYEYAYSLYAKREIDIEDGSSLVFALREQPEYKDRFKGNAKRKSLGYNELLPATYIAMEKAYKDTLAANGLPKGFYDDNNDFADFIGGDVSVAELNSRLKDAYRIVQDSSPEVKTKMAEMYGITDGDLLAYVIDKDRARDLMSPDYKRQAQAALIAESAQRLSSMSINKDVAEKFVRQGITQVEAETAFTSIGQMRELRRGGFGEQGITDVQFAEGTLGTDAEAKRLVDERKKRRIGDVTASGGSATLSQGDSGSYKSGYGKANP